MATNLFKLEVVSPDRVFYTGDVEMVEMNTTEGEIGVYPGHIPTTAIVAPGMLRIHEEGEVKEAVLLEGIVKILGDGITILAEACEWPEEIDIVRANEAKIRAERRLKGLDGEVNVDRAAIALRRSIVRIQAAEKYGKLKDVIN